jgi:hypothetical protein
MKKVSVILTMLLSLVFTSMTMAATSEVKWTNSGDYRDVDAGNGHRAKFKEKVFTDFEKHFTKLAEKLPKGQSLLIDVKDVDLAGDVNIGGINRIRVIKELYSPRMAFSYQVLDANKAIIFSGDVNLKDMGFMMGASMRYKHESLAYEKKMLDDWFEDTFTNN